MDGTLSKVIYFRPFSTYAMTFFSLCCLVAEISFKQTSIGLTFTEARRAGITCPQRMRQGPSTIASPSCRPMPRTMAP